MRRTLTLFRFEPRSGPGQRLGCRLSKLLTAMTYAFCMIPTVSCNEDGLVSRVGNVDFAHRLSAYSIFAGELKNLSPAEGFHVYELSTELFSDYALKQRLIRLPEGNVLIEKGVGLPDFPDSTVMVKTFYYFHDFRDPSEGRRIVETRLLVKQKGKWDVATYVWNESQTDALLVDSGLNTTVNWINEKGEAAVISYHVPSVRECVTCHSYRNEVIPIGPKIRNLNRLIIGNGGEVNQLAHLEDLGLLKRTGIPVWHLPSWNDRNTGLEDRARAYLDVNCGHCHTPGGFANEVNLSLTFEETEGGADIRQRKDAIAQMIRRGRMPLIGTTLVHREGLELIESYIKSLK